MTEVTFIRQNLEKWGRIEQLCNTPKDYDPQVIANAYHELCADLAFAQTHYPEARITTYLNDLALSLHVQLYRRPPLHWQHILRFFKVDAPLMFYKCRRELLASLIVFIIGTLIGCVSQIHDTEFARIVMGSNYVDMTLKNIQDGKPMAVYGSVNEVDMFLGITLNNIGVSLMAYASGLLTLFGTGMLLLYNSVMLGCFQTFFIQKALGWDSFVTIWLHGTLEISAIVVSGAAGIRLGTGWLFPETFTRKAAFMHSARQSLYLVGGMFPLFVTAGFIEAFFTRHTEWPDWLNLIVIALSLIFVIYYVVVLPHKLGHHLLTTKKL